MTIVIVLTGLSGSGKTSVGGALAEQLGCRFIDTDQLIEADAGRPITEIFSNEGESFFRELETKQLTRLLNEAGADCVVSTGGGIVVSEQNRKLLKKLGKVIFLMAPVKLLAARLSGDDTRPLLNANDNQLNNGNAKEQIERLSIKLENLLEARKDAYMEADLVLDTSDGSAHDIAVKILSLLKLETRRL